MQETNKKLGLCVENNRTNHIKNVSRYRFKDENVVGDSI